MSEEPTTSRSVLRKIMDTPGIDMNEIRRKVDEDFANGKTTLEFMEEFAAECPPLPPEASYCFPASFLTERKPKKVMSAEPIEEPTTEPVTEEPKAPEGMSVYLRSKLAHKHRKNLAALQLALEAGPVTMESLMEKYGWCRTRAYSALQMRWLLGGDLKQAAK